MDQSNLSQDANNRIMKIANGLQSDHLGVKCEAIADFSYVVKKYPFPVVISPLFFRLIESFQNGPNYLRLVILKNCEACKEHLGKIICSTEIVNIFSQNMESNDPCARAICLKMIGLLNPIFNNNKLVHHMIMLCLDSNYDIEVNAAVEACNHYAKVSNEFSTALCPKLCTKLESLSTDLKLKLQLIKLAKYFHHDADTFERTRACLISLLDGYQSLEFVTNLLYTLTYLATRSSMHSKQQIDILLNQLDMEERDEVMIAVLDNALILARHMAHIWTEDYVNTLCCYYNKLDLSRNASLVASCRIVELLSILAESLCPTSMFATNSEKSLALGLVIECASKAALMQANANEVIFKTNYCGIQLLCIISSTTSDHDLAEHTLNTYSVNVGNLWRTSLNRSCAHILKCNIAITKLILQFPDLLKGFLYKNVSIIVQELRDGCHCDNDGFSLVCRFMAQFCVHVTMSTADCLPRATDVLNIVHSHDHRRSSLQVLAVCAFIFQLSNCEGGALLSTTDTTHLIEWISRCNNNNWLIYRVARMANRYNQHGAACLLYERMLPAVISAKYTYWLKGLHELSKAETMLMSLDSDDVSNLINSIVESQKHFLKSANFFKCSGTAMFINCYVKIRWEFLTAIYTLLVTLNQYGSKFTTNNANFVILYESKSLFESNIKKISELISYSLDADDTTIEQLKWLRKLSSLFVQSLHAIISNYNPDVDIPLEHRNCHQDYWLRQLCDEICSTLTGLSGGGGDQQQNQVASKIRLMTTLAMNSIKIGVPLPRFLFQKLQSTEVRPVAILNGKTITTETTAAGGGSGGGLSLRQDQSHKLQVFGVVTQTSKLPGRLVRRVAQVRISIEVVPWQGAGRAPEGGQGRQVVTDEVVRLSGDFFSTVVLLDLRGCQWGRYRLGVRASPVDAAGGQWAVCEGLDCALKVEASATKPVQTPR